MVHLFSCDFIDGEIVLPSDVSEIFRQGKRAGSFIHSISWGFKLNNYGNDERQIDAFAFNNEDFVLVAAAGNSGSTDTEIDILGSVYAPGVAKNVITVGASQNEGFSGFYGKITLRTFHQEALPLMVAKSLK